MILAVFVHDILGSSADQREKLVVAEPGTVDAYMQRIIKLRHKVRVVARLQRQVVLAGDSAASAHERQYSDGNQP